MSCNVVSLHCRKRRSTWIRNRNIPRSTRLPTTHNVTGHHVFQKWRYSYETFIIESVDSICRDSADTQYILIQTNFPKSPKQLFDVERYVGWGCILNCFMLSSLPCFYAFCWSAIPTSCYIFNAVYSCRTLYGVSLRGWWMFPVTSHHRTVHMHNTAYEWWLLILRIHNSTRGYWRRFNIQQVEVVFVDLQKLWTK